MVKLVLFDIDGTLIRTGGAGVRAFGNALRTEFGLTDGARGLQFAGRTDTGLLREIMTAHGIATNAENSARFFTTYVQWLQHWLTQLEGEICPGVPRFLGGLSALRPRPMIGLLTGNIRLGAEIKLRHYQLWEEFEAGAFSDVSEDRNQIAAHARDQASRLLGHDLKGDEIVVVGDTPLDIECARAIGARVAGVATGGFTREQLGAFRPDWLLENLNATEASAICLS